VSSTGLLAYRSGEAGQRQLTWFDRSGKVSGTLGARDANALSSPLLSPDGRRAAVVRTVQGNNDIWLVDSARSTRFTSDESLDRWPLWSPDGNRIVFDSNRQGRRDLYVKDSTSGAANEELLLESAQNKIPNDWSRDGRFLLYVSSDPQTLVGDLWILPMEGEHKPFLFLKTNFDERRGQFSPDGRWVAYSSDESGTYEIYVRAFDGRSSGSAAGGQSQVSASGGIYARWRADGRELYYIAPDSKLMAVPIAVRGERLEAGTPVVLFQTRIGGSTDPNRGIQYDVSRDGRFLINTDLEDVISPISLLQNWNPEAKK
jgi:dipeptidyl aminopeptidase/acylaminoacyl peptidase